jgi:UDP-N-acetylenolpyruvoylglucosamine reductase
VAGTLIACVSRETRVTVAEPMSRHTTLRVGGVADVFVEPAGEADLAAVLRLAAERQWPWLVLGRGSNLLVRDGGVRGLVISLGQAAFCGVRVEGTRLFCGAGVRVKAVAAEARRHGLTGLEFLDGIPGSVGGALRMNAGAMGSWTFGVVERVRYVGGAGWVGECLVGELPVKYRSCPFFREHVAVAAVFSGIPAPEAEIRERMEAWNRRRWDTQPAQPSAGCIFKNPAERPAGRLIDEAGLKGTRVGGAVVSAVHANFIVNEGTATARDILELIGAVQERVLRERGVVLEPEVEIIGEEAPA